MEPVYGLKGQSGILAMTKNGHWGWLKVMSLWTGCLRPWVRGRALLPVTNPQLGTVPRYLFFFKHKL